MTVTYDKPVKTGEPVDGIIKDPSGSSGNREYDGLTNP